MLVLRFKRSAEKELLGLPAREQKRLGEQLLALRENPFPHGCAKLQGRDGHRIRYGDYRAIYRVDVEAGTVTVMAIGHRRDVYR